MGRSVLVLILCAGIGVPLISTIVFGARPERPADFVFPIVVSLLPALAAATYFRVYPTGIRRNMGRMVDRSPQLQSQTVWRFSDTKIEVDTENSSAALDWSVFGSAVEIEKHYILVQSANPAFVYFIGKRALETPEAKADFRALLELKLGTIKDETKLKTRTIPVLERAGVAGLVGIGLIYWLLLVWIAFR